MILKVGRVVSSGTAMEGLVIHFCDNRIDKQVSKLVGLGLRS